jgi:hypothetical protein
MNHIPEWAIEHAKNTLARIDEMKAEHGPHYTLGWVMGDLQLLLRLAEELNESNRVRF